MISQPWVLAGLVSAWLQPAGAACQDVVWLGPKYEPGQSRYVEWSQMTVSRKADDRDAEPPKRFRQTWGVIETVESVSSEGVARIRLVIDRIVNEFDGGPMPQWFDSDVDGLRRCDHALAPLLRPMLRESMVIEIARDGTVKSFEGIDAITTKLSKLIEQSPDAAALREKLERMKIMLNDANGRVMWGESRVALFPFREVRPGDTWSRLMQQTFPSGDIQYDITCRLEKLSWNDDRMLAHVSYEAVIGQPHVSPADSRMPLARNFRGRSRGSAVLDVGAGQCLHEEESVMMEFDVSGGGPESAGSAMTIRQKMESVTRTMTLEEREKQKQANSRLANKNAKP